MLLRRTVTTGFLAIALIGCGTRPGTRTSHNESKTFPSAPGKLVVLDVRSLDAEVEVVEGGSIDVTVELQARSSSRAAAGRWVERNTPTLADAPTRLEITTPRRGSVSVIGFIETEGVLRVRVPAECRLEVRTASGDVALRGTVQMAAPVRIDTTSGDVTVRGGARELLVDTSSGDVRVAGEALAVLEAETASGDVVLDAGAERVVVDTSSGESVLRKLRGNLSVSSQSGDVDARWLRLAAGNRVTVETSSGEVTLRLAAGVPVTGEVQSSSGRIESELPGEEDRRGRRFRLSAPATPTEAGPESAGGAVELSVRTGSGNVQLLETSPTI
jgi:hypothetical protein